MLSMMNILILLIVVYFAYMYLFNKKSVIQKRPTGETIDQALSKFVSKQIGTNSTSTASITPMSGSGTEGFSGTINGKFRKNRMNKSLHFKHKQNKPDNYRDSLLNGMLKDVSDINDKKEAPELEHFEDYAPVMTPTELNQSSHQANSMKTPVLPQSAIIPNNILFTASDAKTGQPLESNGMTQFDNKAVFQSQLTRQFNDKMTSQDLTFNFKRLGTGPAPSVMSPFLEH